jgi:type IV secretory pathway ATPase VirB11/archaellum biosynthesis ATPase
VKSKINNIRRFFTLLFTDKDLVEKNIFDDFPVSLNDAVPEWLDQDTKLEPIFEPTIETSPIIRVETQNIGPDKEEVSTRILKKTIKLEPSPSLDTTMPEIQEYFQKKVNTNNEKNNQEKIILGISADNTETVGVDMVALKRHMLVVGMTGSGKTTMLERMILQDIDAGRGVGLIDPHGDLYDKILGQIPKSRSNDVVLFDLTDVDYPI